MNSLVHALHSSCLLFHLDQDIHSIDHLLDELHFRLAHTTFIGNVELPVRPRGGMFAARTASLQAHVITELLQGMDSHFLVEFGEFQHD